MKKQNTIALFFLLLSVSMNAQQVKLTGLNDHYKTLAQFNGAPAETRSWMDTIEIPAVDFGGSITYLLAKPYYLSENEVKSLTASVKFPAHSSDQVRGELDYLLELQRKRSPEQVDRVTYLGNIGYWPPVNLVPMHPGHQENLKHLFFEGREVLGEQINASHLPKVSKLLQGVMHDMRLMEFTIKYTLLRPRPYHLEPKLEPVARISSPSFVSGHTLWAFLQAFVWSEIIPEKQNEFIALAEEIRRSREILGIHYPSDNEAARQVAYKMLQYYFTNKAFKQDYKDAVEEWKSVAPKLLAIQN